MTRFAQGMFTAFFMGGVLYIIAIDVGWLHRPNQISYMKVVNRQAVQPTEYAPFYDVDADTRLLDERIQQISQ